MINMNKRTKLLRVTALLATLTLLLSGCTTPFSSILSQNHSSSLQTKNWEDANVATSVDGVVNLLLVGQDTRDESVRQRSDSMMILSINENTNQMTLLSLMRDLYVEIPEHGHDRLNAAYAYGGFDLLDATIAQNFGVAIDYNVEVNFSGFQDIVENVGGVDITLTEEEVEYMNSDTFAKTMGYKTDTPFVAGSNHLDGKQALCYARIRRVGDDFARTQRQRTIFQAVFKKLKGENWTTLLNVYGSISDDLTTDMSPLQMISIAHSAYSIGLDSLNSYRIPDNGMYENQTIDGMMVLVPTDWDATRSHVQELLYGSPKEKQ